jgi:hypothetical protein
MAGRTLSHSTIAERSQKGKSWRAGMALPLRRLFSEHILSFFDLLLSRVLVFDS